MIRSPKWTSVSLVDTLQRRWCIVYCIAPHLQDPACSRYICSHVNSRIIMRNSCYDKGRKGMFALQGCGIFLIRYNYFGCFITMYILLDEINGIEH